MKNDAPAVDRDTIVPRMERLLDRLASRRGVEHRIVGAAALDGSWSWAGAAGRDAGAAVQADAPWFLASVTKLYVAAVVLRLYEQGLVDLRAPIRTYLPPELSHGLHVLDGVDYTDRITPVHLLGHLTGLPDCLDERVPGGRSLVEEVVEEGDRAWTFQEAVARARDLLTPHFAPSDPDAGRPRISYSDTNYQLLMVMIEHTTGRSMGEVYREMLFKPLQLVDTWLPGERSTGSTGEPATVWLGDRRLTGIPLALRSFGDLYSTTEDVLRFGRALFSGEVFDDPATAHLMWQRFRRFGFPRGTAALRAPGWPIEYGLGMMRFELSRWMTSGVRIPGLIGHTGSTGSWLWHASSLGLLLAGTVDQASAATLPYRVVPRTLAGLPRR